MPGRTLYLDNSRGKITVGLRPTVLTVGAGGDCLYYSPLPALSCLFFFLSLSGRRLNID